MSVCACWLHREAQNKGIQQFHTKTNYGRSRMVGPVLSFVSALAYKWVCAAIKFKIETPSERASERAHGDYYLERRRHETNYSQKG